MARDPLLILLHDDTAPGLRGRIHRSCLAAILEGALRPGDRIPSSRRLAQDWRVARNTVDEALAELQAEGWLVRRVGDGTRVASSLPLPPGRASAVAPRPLTAFARAALTARSAWGRSVEQAHASGAVPRPVAFVAGMAALDAFPLDTWRRVAARRARVDGTQALGYPPALGDWRLREALARHLAMARGLHCDAGRVMICNSAMQAVELIARVMLERGAVAWLEDPGYPNLRGILDAAGARVVAVPVDREGLGVDAAAARSQKPAMICVTPACHHPTGVAMSLPRRLALIRAAEAAGAWIVEEDYQSEFVHEGRPLAPVAHLDGGARTFCVGTFSHALFPSLRLAWCVLPASLVPVFEAVRRQLDDHTHGPLQPVLGDFIDGGHFAAHLRRMRALYGARREALRRALAALPRWARVGPMQAGMNVAVHLPARLRDTAVVARLADAGVATVPLSRYALDARINGLLLGYTALDEGQIVQGATRLAGVLRTFRT
jgi:GntR family transcriptional regulator/MocR family aminotransferase